MEYNSITYPVKVHIIFRFESIYNQPENDDDNQLNNWSETVILAENLTMTDDYTYDSNSKIASCFKLGFTSDS